VFHFSLAEYNLKKPQQEEKTSKPNWDQEEPLFAPVRTNSMFRSPHLSPMNTTNYSIDTRSRLDWVPPADGALMLPQNKNAND